MFHQDIDRDSPEAQAAWSLGYLCIVYLIVWNLNKEIDTCSYLRRLILLVKDSPQVKLVKIDCPIFLSVGGRVSMRLAL